MSNAKPGEMRSYATIHCIGIEWDIAGDTNHDAICAVQFRRKGAASWRPALPLFRVDYKWQYGKKAATEAKNMFAGSLLFLRPATDYEVKLTLNDPDGASQVKELTVRTRSIPELPKRGRTLHVTPGSGGGTGATRDPFRGVAAAEAAAQAGDLLLLHKGNYGAVKLTKSGAALGRYIAWKAAGDGEVLLDSVDISASHVWIEGMHITAGPGETGSGVFGRGESVGVVVSGNHIVGFEFGVRLTEHCQDWTITDNDITGNKLLTPGQDDARPLDGEGVELGHSVGGHVVCYNRITRVADGISYPGHDCDVYGNDIFGVTDDALEFDYGWANNRAWGNRLTDFHHYGLSFQPMFCGPWYFIRNQIVGGQRTRTHGAVEGPTMFKFRVQDRFLLVNNTFVGASYLSEYSDALFTSYSRNNLYISSTGNKPLWLAHRYPEEPERGMLVMPLLKPDWRTDVDYDGFDWGDDPADSKTPVFRYDTALLVNLDEFRQTTGVERHAVRVRKEAIFQQWNIPSGVGPVPRSHLTLKPDSNAVDTGAVAPGINDNFAGKAPDLGAAESGKPLPHYGPRDGKARKQHALYWAIY